MNSEHPRGSAAQPAGTASGVFLEHRGLLFTVAYELLGSATDAEDLVQETWLRWAAVDLGAIREPVPTRSRSPPGRR